MTDIYITGVGVVSPLGHEPATLGERVIAGESALGPIEGLDVSPFPCRVGARVTDFRAAKWVENRKNLKTMTPAVRFGVAAVRKAAIAAGIAPASDESATGPHRLGMFVGAGTAFGDSLGLVPAIEASTSDGGFDARKFGATGMDLIHPLWLLKGLSNNVLGFATAALNAQGINQNYCNSGAGGMQAIGEAMWAIAENRADVIIAGGADSAVNAEHLTGFGRLGLLSETDRAEEVRPFDRQASGFAPGEGAAFFVLERGEHMRAREKRPLARVAGYGTASAVQTVATTEPRAIEHACRRALETAGWQPGDIDYIQAHGNGNPPSDRDEAVALRAVFGTGGPPISADKAHLGHTVAACGPLSLAVALEAARRGTLPAIAHLGAPSPWCEGLDLVMGSARQTAVRRLLVHAAGLGGQTCFLAVESELE